MGSGIAQVCAQAGLDVVGVDVAPGAAERARERIATYLARGVEKGRLSAAERDAALARLQLGGNLDALAGCDAVIEAIVEELEAKQALFAQLGDLAGPEALLATNTSALPVSAIATAAAHPERVVGMHF